MKGFTLIEVAVTLSILGISTLIVGSAFPVWRDQQQQLAAVQQIKSLIREAQQRSLNSKPSEACLKGIEGDEFTGSKVCSKIGLALKGSNYYLFIDRNEDNVFKENQSDIVLDRGVLPGAVTAAADDWQTFLFIPTPPTTTLYVDGLPLAPQPPATISLRQADHRLNLRVYSSGVVEQQL